MVLTICPACPECSSRLSRVVMTRHLADGRTVRRRACYICDHRWYSLQAAESAVAATMLQWRGKQLLGVLTP